MDRGLEVIELISVFLLAVHNPCREFLRMIAVWERLTYRRTSERT